MRQWLVTVIIFLFLSPCSSIMAAPSSSGGGGGGLSDACEMSGGNFTGAEGGNWACCWSNWGCYGCVDGHCKIKCNTNRCRKANSARQAAPDVQPVRGLAPNGMKAPMAPTNHKQSSKATTLKDAKHIQP